MDKKEIEIEYISSEEFDEEFDSLSHYGVGHLNGGNSGRYPWGSGDSPFQTSTDFYSRVREMEKEGMTTKEIADALKMTTTQLKAAKTIAGSELRGYKVAYAKHLKEDGMNNVEIGVKLGERFNPDHSPIGESTVRSLLDGESETRMKLASGTANELKAIVDEKGFIDIGEGTEKYLNQGLGIHKTKLDVAVEMLKMEGYEVKSIRVEQVTNKGNWTTVKVLAKPGTTYSDVYKARQEGKIKSIFDYSDEITRDTDLTAFKYPESMDSKRIKIRYDEEGGTEKDGLVEIRRGVPDLSLGGSNYSQVRILVDGTHYIKGMAVYGRDEDFPDGVDIIFNSNKKKSVIGDDVHEALKSVKENLAKDPNNPFGSAIKEINGQSFYNDPNGKYINPETGERQSLSLINKRSDEGDWNTWARELPSQFLSKQPVPTIKKQLKLTEEDKEAEYNEIMSLTNPTVKRALLEDFANDCDSSSVHLKAAALPGQVYKVIMPLPSLKDNEIYNPDLPNGTEVALVRFPHGGIFEIPKLKVNNNNQEGIDYLTKTPDDAVGINSKVAGILSGADFDGDTVMVIPITGKTTVSNKPPFDGLKDFNTKLEYGPEPGGKLTIDGVDYGYRNGHKYKRMTDTQMQMGVISNLITDMTLEGANASELERAVRHSMVVIDAEKHWLDYKQSELDNNIEELKKNYQRHNYDNRYGGASTLLSRAKSKINTLPERKPGAYFTKDGEKSVNLIDPENKIFEDPKTGEIYNTSQVHKLNFDPKTGEKVYTNTGRYYYKVKLPGDKKERSVVEKDDKFLYKNDEGKFVELPKEYEVKLKKHEPTSSSSKMAEAKDARELVSTYNTPQELAYADYANKLKSLANKARMEAYRIEDIPYSSTANKLYQEQADSLEYQLNQHIRNKPKERQAQVLASSRVDAKLKENPSLKDDPDHFNKLKQMELRRARAIVGAARSTIFINDAEWAAIQAGAISKTRLKEIIDASDKDRLKELAMPREKKQISDAKIARMKNMAENGYSTAEIARHFSVSSSTITKLLNKE